MLLTGDKTDYQIQAMREGGKILASIFKDLEAYTQPGMNELDIDAWVDKQIRSYGATPTYREPEVDFNGSICISVNEELIHGLPKDNVLENGDKVSYDLTITYKGMKTDSAFTMIVGEQPKGAIKHLINTTNRSLYAGIDVIKDGVRTGDIGSAVEEVLVAGKLGVIREYVGHGIGESMHMPPEVPNYGNKNSGVVLRAGDTICIEPMASLGQPKTTVDQDSWTVSMSDGSLCAHFEHTVLITETGYEILTTL